MVGKKKKIRINRDAAEEAFMSFSLSPGIEFKLNDPVEITSGEHTGARGAVISIYVIDPEVTFLIELGDGSGDIIIAPIRTKSSMLHWRQQESVH